MDYGQAFWPEVIFKVLKFKCLDGFVFLQISSFSLHKTLIDGVELF